MPKFSRIVSVLTFATVACLLACTIAAADYSESFSFSGDRLTVANLIGGVVVKGGGDTFEVKVRVRGSDASTGIVTFDEESDALSIVFPTDKHKRYVYPEMESNRTSMSFNTSSDRGILSSLISAISGSDKIQVSRSGSGLQVWADLEITVPEGRSLVIENGVGSIAANNVTGDLILDGSSGSVTAIAIDGDLGVDTGSGDVLVEKIHGKLSVDTGSGDVEGFDLRVSRVLVDTGSGDVQLNQVETDALDIDTGSGDVIALDVVAENASIDTGSGDVKLSLVEMGDGKFVVDTGSGRIALLVPDNMSATVNADTGSGGIDYNLTGDVDVRHKERNELRLVVGGGSARVDLDTGSGGISLRNISGS